MKRLILSLVLAAGALLLLPLSASAATYETFVGCNDLSSSPIPTHVCQLGDFPGAYFESDVDTEYEVCVEFPGGSTICAEEEFADGGVLYVNSITSSLEGAHFVSWYVEGIEVGSWAFNLELPAPPPATPVTLPPPPSTPALPAVAPAPSAGCLKAQRQIGKLKSRLRQASGPQQKHAIRNRLKNARSAAALAC